MSKIAEKVCPFLTIMVVSLYFDLFLLSENSLDKLLISIFEILGFSFRGEIIWVNFIFFGDSISLYSKFNLYAKYYKY